ncbi:MAG: Gmad2 immunoglobulin-like domain-containing protein, partial [Actinomycetota bacterium]
GLLLAACGTRPKGTGPDSTASPGGDYFAGFWPVGTPESAQSIQDQVDAGRQPWRLDPRSVAARFAEEFVGWRRVDLLGSDLEGSAAAGWRAAVLFRPYTGEEHNLRPGTRHTLGLVGLKGAARPAWFVSSLGSEHILVESPRGGDPISSPLLVSGRGIGFEATISVKIADDGGRALHPQPGILMGGATEVAPFSGSLEFDRPAESAGILILTGSQGAEGPVPDQTIVRVRFWKAG